MWYLRRTNRNFAKRFLNQLSPNNNLDLYLKPEMSSSGSGIIGKDGKSTGHHSKTKKKKKKKKIKDCSAMPTPGNKSNQTVDKMILGRETTSHLTSKQTW